MITHKMWHNNRKEITSVKTEIEHAVKTFNTLERARQLKQG